MKRWVTMMMVLVLVVIGASTAGAAISNGDFELSVGDTFTDWAEATGGANVEMGSVIGGSKSAEIVNGGIITQSISGPTNFLFSMDFAVFPYISSRTFQLNLMYGPGEADQINIMVEAGNALKAYSQTGGWMAIGALTANTTTDTGTANIWDGETPVVNHLEIKGYFGVATPYYDVTLNGATVSGVTYFQGPAGGPAAGNDTINLVRLMGQTTQPLIDNVAMEEIPTPPRPPRGTVIMFR